LNEGTNKGGERHNQGAPDGDTQNCLFHAGTAQGCAGATQQCEETHGEQVFNPEQLLEWKKENE
jgi:hypothetical protein